MAAAQQERPSPRQPLPSPDPTIICWSLNPLWQPGLKWEPTGQCQDPLSGVKTRVKDFEQSPVNTCLLGSGLTIILLSNTPFWALCKGSDGQTTPWCCLTWADTRGGSRLTLPLQHLQFECTAPEDKPCFHYLKKNNKKIYISETVTVSDPLECPGNMPLLTLTWEHSLFITVSEKSVGCVEGGSKRSKLSGTVKPTEGGGERQREEWESNTLNKAEECTALSSCCCCWWAEQAHVMWSGRSTKIIT